eukprot:COSAG06_NODE_1611_length_8936_cov_2.495078_10_plen_39_part_00
MTLYECMRSAGRSRDYYGAAPPVHDDLSRLSSRLGATV